MSKLKDSLRQTYDGMVSDKELKHIPEISHYNHNYYLGIKRDGNVTCDLIYVESDDDDYSEYYLVLPEGHFIIGFSLTSQGDIIHFDEECSL